MHEINAWPGRWFLISTFDNEPDCDVAEIQRILEVDNTVSES